MYVLNANHISKSYKTAGETMRILQNGNLAKEVKKENTADNFREDIWKTLCGLGGGKDDLF